MQRSSRPNVFKLREQRLGSYSGAAWHAPIQHFYTTVTTALEKECAGMGAPAVSDYLLILRFVDDQTIVAQHEEEMRFMIWKLEGEYRKSGLQTNLDKTKYLINNARSGNGIRRRKNQKEEGRAKQRTVVFNLMG